MKLVHCLVLCLIAACIYALWHLCCGSAQSLAIIITCSYYLQYTSAPQRCSIDTDEHGECLAPSPKQRILLPSNFLSPLRYAIRAAAERSILVEFNADVTDGMPWKFRPTQRAVRVKPGESALAFYTAHNNRYGVFLMRDLLLHLACSLWLHREGSGLDIVNCASLLYLLEHQRSGYHRDLDLQCNPSGCWSVLQQDSMLLLRGSNSSCGMHCCSGSTC